MATVTPCMDVYITAADAERAELMRIRQDTELLLMKLLVVFGASSA